MRAELVDFLTELMAPESEMQSAFARLTALAHSLGIDHVNLGTFQPVVDGPPAAHLWSTMPAAWIDEYTSRGLSEHDYAVCGLLNGDSWPKLSRIEWDAPELVRTRKAQPATLEVLAASAEAGMKEALAFGIGLNEPIRHDVPGLGPAGFACGIGIAERSANGSYFRHLRAVEALMVTACFALLPLLAESHRRERISVSALSRREREVLQRLSVGDRPGAIADRLNIATVTVNLHIMRARRKLGARTSAEAVAKAIWLGLLH